MSKAPAYISHIVIVHAGSYKDFINKLTKDYPYLIPKFIKRTHIHYYVIQLEDHNQYEKEDIYKLPIMAMREELSSFIFFKTDKILNNLLKRMTDEKSENPINDLIQETLTPYEKRILCKMDEAKSLTLEEPLGIKDGTKITTIYDKKEMISISVLAKIFPLSLLKINDKEINFVDEVRKMDWNIRIIK